MYALPKTRRRIIFYISALAFFAVAPFLILYSLGYSFDIKRRTMEETGGIFVKTNLTSFTVSLNNGAIQKSSLLTRGLLLSNLQPGQYRIHIEKDGYRPWEKIISVTRLSVREIRNIILLPNILAKKNAAIWDAEERLERSFVSPKTQYAAVVLQHSRTGRRTLLFFKPSENKITARFPVSEAVQEIIWNTAEDEALLVAGEQARKYKRLALSETTLRQTALFEKPITVSGAATPSRIAQQNVKKIEFGDTTNNFLILTDTGSLLFLNAATTSAVILAESVAEFEALGDNIFFVAENGFAALQTIRGNTTINLGRKGYAPAGTPIAALQTGRGDLFFKDGAGGLFFSSRGGSGEFNLAETGVRGIAFDGKEEKLFFLKQNAIGVMRLEDGQYQPFEKRGNTAMLFQSNDTAFLDAIWLTEDNAHIILNTSSGVFLLDTDAREGPRIAELDPKPAEKIFWNQEGGKLYLIRDTGIEAITIE